MRGLVLLGMCGGLLALGGCAAGPASTVKVTKAEEAEQERIDLPGPWSDNPRLPDPPGLYAAVLRSMLARHPDPDIVFCVGFRPAFTREHGRREPLDMPDPVLSRLREDSAWVAPRSACLGARPETYFRGVDASGKELPPRRARRIFVTVNASLAPCEGDNTVAFVSGEVDCGGSCAARYFNSLGYQEGRWQMGSTASSPL